MKRVVLIEEHWLRTDRARSPNNISKKDTILNIVFIYFFIIRDITRYNFLSMKKIFITLCYIHRKIC